MRGKGLILLGVIGGALFASTDRGGRVVADLKGRAQKAWSRPDVQRRVDDVQDGVRTGVPLVGGTIADAINKVKPQGPADQGPTA